jgi:hypothetical protein
LPVQAVAAVKDCQVGPVKVGDSNGIAPAATLAEGQVEKAVSGERAFEHRGKETIQAGELVTATASGFSAH